MAAKKKGVSPAQSQRDSLTAEVQARGKKVANIWLLWSAKNDEDVVLVGDLKADHFFACEGDPRIAAVTYNPESIQVAVGEKIERLNFAARVTLQDNTTELHIVSANRGTKQLLERAAEISGATLVHVTPAYLDPMAIRIGNWRRALRFLSCCRNRSLANVENAVSHYLFKRSQASLGEVVAHVVRDGDDSLVVAAIVSLLSKRLIESDMDFHYLSLKTTLSAKVSVA